ncbi:MAG: tRNA-dihydrouridine synthase [Bacteroidales bacterium]|nr:tRNA-dihydrouridine synthase [Bacteroidales bacterium]
MSEVSADWEEVGKAAAIRNEKNPETLIFGNGDILSIAQANEKAKQYHLDGVMIGRGVFHNPWVFNPGYEPSLTERLDTLLLHTQLFDDYWQDQRNFAVLRRFYKIYVQGFPGASKLRVALMETQNKQEVTKVMNAFRQENTSIVLDA